MNRNIKIFIAIILVATLLGITASYALQTWRGAVSFSVDVKEFQVYRDAGLTQLWATNTPVALGIVQAGVQPVVNFWIMNIGNVAFTVAVNTVSTVGCTVSWSNSGSYTVPQGGNVNAQLTITVTGTGSYTFDFVIA